VGVALPEGGTRGAAMLARDLLYTAATRAKREVAVFGPATLVERAVQARPRRVSGLSDALRAAEGPAPPR
jgi:ATP-dependent exoDNAse (exonuclease V) alpha subunit